MGVRMQAFDFDSPEVLWGGALWWWAFRGGDLSQCVDLLRRCVPIPADLAQDFADVLEGKIVPRSSLGGPKPESQLRRASRDHRVRKVFELFLYAERKAFDDPLVPACSRDGAAELTAAALVPSMTVAQVLKIVNRRETARYKTFAELVIQKP